MINWLVGFFGSGDYIHIEEHREVIEHACNLEDACIHYQKGIEALLNESYKLGHITKDKVQLMCHEALQVPK